MVQIELESKQLAALLAPKLNLPAEVIEKALSEVLAEA